MINWTICIKFFIFMYFYSTFFQFICFFLSFLRFENEESFGNDYVWMGLVVVLCTHFIPTFMLWDRFWCCFVVVILRWIRVDNFLSHSIKINPKGIRLWFSFLFSICQFLFFHFNKIFFLQSRRIQDIHIGVFMYPRKLN